MHFHIRLAWPSTSQVLLIARVSTETVQEKQTKRQQRKFRIKGETVGEQVAIIKSDLEERRKQQSEIGQEDEKQIVKNPTPLASETKEIQRISKKTQIKPRLYGCGLALSGALSNANFIYPRKEQHQIHKCTTPYHIPLTVYGTVKQVNKAAAGHGFSLATTTREGSILLGTGLNTDGQLGFVTNKRNPDHSLQWCWRFTRLNIDSKIDKLNPIISLDCGRAHSVFATKKAVYAMGNNAHGQCGRSINENEDYSLALEGIREVDLKLNRMEGIATVSCGQEHTLILTDHGRVFVAGLGTDGQLGVGVSILNRSTFEPLTSLNNCFIVQASTFADSNLVLDTNGYVYGWGNNEYNQISPESCTSIDEPVRLDHINEAVGGARIIQVASGGCLSGVLTDVGDIYTWGYSFLGDGPDIIESSVPRRLSRAYFGGTHPNDYETRNASISYIAAGLMNFAAVTKNTGLLYMWGLNRYGQLGTRDAENRYTPTKISYSGVYPSMVSMSSSHTLITCSMKKPTYKERRKSLIHSMKAVNKDKAKY